MSLIVAVCRATVELARRLLLFLATGGVGWAIYTCVLSYWISTALADFAIASIVISGVVTTVLVAGVYWLDRRRCAGDARPAATGDPGRSS